MCYSRISLFLFLVFISFLLQSCNNLFDNPQPKNIKNELRIPSAFQGTFKSQDNDLKIESGADFINTEERRSFKDIKKVFFTKNDKNYVISDGKECRILDVKFRNDSVFGKIIERNEYRLNDNLIVRKVNNYYVFNFKKYEDWWSPFFIVEEGSSILSYSLKSEILKKYPTNDKQSIIEDFDEEDVNYFFKRKKEFFEPHYKFDKNLKEIKILLFD